MYFHLCSSLESVPNKINLLITNKRTKDVVSKAKMKTHPNIPEQHLHAPRKFCYPLKSEVHTIVLFLETSIRNLSVGCNNSNTRGSQ